MLYDAALRNLQTLSEATQLLPANKKAAWPAIPWREISGFRNILVHNYLGSIDPLTVATVIDNHLQPLEECMRALLDDAGKTKQGLSRNYFALPERARQPHQGL